MKNITVYSTSNCPNCRVLKQYLDQNGLQYTEIDMTTPAALTELSIHRVFTMSAPVLQIDTKFYKYNEIFRFDRLDQNKLENLIKTQLRDE